jgi:hypothetical protein
MSRWKWAAKVAALEWFADTHGMVVFTGVPLTGASWHGWGPGCRNRTGSVGISTTESPRVVRFEEERFVAGVVSGRPLHPILTWGYADRPAFGCLATAQAYLARSWEPSAAIRPVAIVAPGHDRNNVRLTYDAAGFTVVPVPGPAQTKRGGGGGPADNDPFDAPRPGEDRSIHELWTRRDRLGWWLAEVPVGFVHEPTDRRARRIDAAVVSWPVARHSKARADLDEFGHAVGGGLPVELIEAKGRLNSATIGQLLSGASMFAQSWPGHGPLSLTACVREDGDEAIRWYCERSDITVEVVTPRPPTTASS